jgi:hypothetical protein
LLLTPLLPLLLLLLQFHLNVLALTHTDCLELLHTLPKRPGRGVGAILGEVAASPRLGRRQLLQEALGEQQRQHQL